VGAADILRSELRAGARVAVGDGAGAPVGLAEALGEAARAVGNLSFIYGWCFEPPVLPVAPGDALMGGSALREWIREGRVRYLPVRYGSLPELLRGPLRPDVLVAGLVPADEGYAFASEVGWQHEAVAAGARVLAEVNHGLPRASAAPPLPADRVVVVAEVDRPPISRPVQAADARTQAIACRAAELVPEGAALQVAPGVVGEAVLDALELPVSIHSGVVGDGVVRLDERGLLLGEPRASYVAGSESLYRWADGRPIATTIAETHGAGLASLDTFVAVNTAFEIDDTGAANAQGFGGDVIGGVGGLPDFAGAAARSARGLSVIALASERKGASTLVEELSAPATLSRSEIDLVVTEHGVADLRGLSDAEARDALLGAWGEG
jgi:acyl-CoA hydrolase